MKLTDTTNESTAADGSSINYQANSCTTLLNSQKQKYQNFFLQQNYFGKKFIIQSNQTRAFDAVLFSPLMPIDSARATLLIKNNLTLLAPIELIGSSGTIQL